MPTTGWFRWEPPIEPQNGASPNLQIPPSDATLQYPVLRHPGAAMSSDGPTSSIGPGVTALDGADSALGPTPFTACTVNVYVVPPIRPGTTTAFTSGPACAVWPPGLAVTT